MKYQNSTTCDYWAGLFGQRAMLTEMQETLDNKRGNVYGGGQHVIVQH